MFCDWYIKTSIRKETENDTQIKDQADLETMTTMCNYGKNMTATQTTHHTYIPTA